MVPYNVLEEPLTAAERRRYERHELRCRCWIEGDDLTLCAPTIDVGKGGLFLRTAIPIRAGSVVDVWLQVLGESDALSARGVITRTVPAHTGLRHGLGVQFLEILRGERSLTSLITRSPTLPWA